MKRLLRFGTALWASLGLLAAAPGYAQDADGDGVPDGSDAHPCDPALAGEVFAPAEGAWGTLLFEDEWPARGDQDLNDLVLDYNYHLRTDAAGRVVQLTARYFVAALGGEARLGLGVHLPIPRQAIGSATLEDRFGVRSVSPSVADTEATFVLYDEVSALFPGSTPPFNVIAGAASVPGELVVLEVTLAAPLPVASGLAPFDVFAFHTLNPGREVHRAEYPGTSRIDPSLFGSGDDGSGGGRFFVDADGLPFALALPAASDYPLELRHVAQLWPEITTFAASGGSASAGFYQVVQAAHRFAGRVGAPAIAAPPVDQSCLHTGTFPATYNRLWHVAVGGHDTAGDGSEGAPFATLHRAITAAIAGDGVRIHPGTYRLAPQVHYAGTMTAGVFDQNKRLTIFGANEQTILEVYGADSPLRDAHVFSLKGQQTINGVVRGTVVSNLTVHFYPNRSTNYSNAIMGWNSPGAEIRNVVLINRSTTHSWSYVYDNLAPYDTPRVYNSVFVSNGRWQGSYTGRPSYHNCLMENLDASSRYSVLSHNRVRAATSADWSLQTLPADLRHAGDPSIQNPDGTRSHIGVFGGLYAWP